MNEELSVEKLKELGNGAIRNFQFAEAVLHYTHAIKLEPTNYILYSNRSLAFLRIQQYYFALEDAKNTIRLNPTWAKGYYRKAEVEYATYHYKPAIKSYKKALELQPDDSLITMALSYTIQKQQKDIHTDAQVPWVGAGIGIVLGVIIVIADYVCTNKPTLTHPILMAVMTIAIALIGYGFARTWRFYEKWKRDALLEAPLNLDIIDQSSENPEGEGKPLSNRRYTKSQARHRYRKGKS